MKRDSVVAQRLVVIASKQAQVRRTPQHQLEEPQQRFQAVPAIVEKIAEQHDSRLVVTLTFRFTVDQREAGFEREQVAVEVTDEPERRVRNLLDRQGPIGAVRALIVEEHAEAALGVKQRLKLLNRPAHPRTHRAGGHRGARSCPNPRS